MTAACRQSPSAETPPPRELFLGRLEEQESFQRVLRGLLGNWLERNLPTLSQPFRPRSPAPTQPFVFLFHGEGGMGKTTLAKRLHRIARGEVVPLADGRTSDRAFRGRFQTLFLDWQAEKNINLDLQVGHDAIAPLNVLAIAHKHFVAAGRGDAFEGYCRQRDRLAEARKKFERDLKAEPDRTLLDKATTMGATMVSGLLRRALAEDFSDDLQAIGRDPDDCVETSLELSAEGLSQVRRRVRSTLQKEEYELLAYPDERLAQALGEGLAKVSERKPAIVFYDTYEIVDRPECDYVQRLVMQTSGGRVVWVVSGRANLADSERRGNTYFQGYRQQFARLEARAASEFRETEICDYFQQYFARRGIDRTLASEEARAIAEFSLGMPYVVDKIAEMVAAGARLDAALQPVPRQPGEKIRDAIAKEISERCLMHLLAIRTPAERAEDEAAIYALAIAHNPTAELLQHMWETKDLETPLQRLRQRYSFVKVDELGLDEKLAYFLRQYLQAEVRRAGPTVQTLNDRAVCYLERQLRSQSRAIADTADQIADPDLVTLQIDLVYHYFWTDERAGWETLLPRFVEGWQYDLAFARNLLEVAETFTTLLSTPGRKRLACLTKVAVEKPALEDIERALQELERWKQRQELPQAEHAAILLLQRARWLHWQERYEEALQVCLRVEGKVPETAARLQRDLSSAFVNLGFKLGWKKVPEATVRLQRDPSNAFVDLGFVLSRTGENSFRSPEGKLAFEKAVRWNPENAYGHYGLGCLQDRFGEHNSAIQSLQRAISLRGNKYPPAWNALGLVYHTQRKYEEAIVAYKNAIEFNANVAGYHNNLGNIYQFQGKYEEAIAAYKNAIELDANYASPHNGLGVVYKAQGKYEEAIAAYKNAIELDANDVAPHNGLGLVYHAQRKYEEAIAAYKNAIELDANNVAPHYNLGNVYQAQRKYAETIVAYRKAIDIDANFALLHNGLGNAYQAQGKYEEAIAAYQKAIELDANDTYPHNGLGNIYQAQGKYEEAISIFQKAIELDANNAYSHNGLGNAYQAQGKHKAAIVAYERSLNLPNVRGTPASAHTLSYNGLGVVYKAQGKYEKAIVAYKKAIELDVNFAGCHNNLGNVYRAQGKYEKAIAAYKKAIELDANFTLPHNSLSAVYKAQGKYEEAIAAYKKAIALEPDNSYARNRLAFVYLYIDRPDLAIVEFQCAIELEPETVWYVANLGLAHALQGDRPAAEWQWHKAIERLDRDNERDRIAIALYTLALGDPETGIAQLQEAIARQAPTAAFRNIEEDLAILAKCPDAIVGLDRFCAIVEEQLKF